MNEPLLEVRGLGMRYRGATRWPDSRDASEADITTVLDDVSFSIAAGQTLGIVGESGSGKSTIARLVAGLDSPSSGSIVLRIAQGAGTAGHRCGRVQMVFQDPNASLNPRWTVFRTIAESIALSHPAANRAEIARDVELALERVGLDRQSASRYPHQFSGGQRQRISIARALASEPDLLICDEPTSALDMSVQAQIIELLVGLQREQGLSCLFITHNLAILGRIAHQIGVLHSGRLVEYGPTRRLLESPLHPYTRELFAAVPDPRSRRRLREETSGSSQSGAWRQAGGCLYSARCPLSMAVCENRPEPVGSAGDWVACHAAAANTSSRDR